MKELIGRSQELSKIREILTSRDPAIIIVHGRRRIGKTYLIEHALAPYKYLKVEGLESQSKAVQIRSALDSLAQVVDRREISEMKISSWKRLFERMVEYVPGYFSVLYLEEIQWLANYKGSLISDLKHVWDNHFGKIPGFKLILCGSSPSFISKKVIRSKALYNRSQEVISLKPFTFAESRGFFSKTKTPHEVFDGYLLVGGVPPYLQRLSKRSSVLQSLAQESFAPDSFFSEEMEKVFTSSLGENTEYRKIIRALVRSPGLTVSEIADKLKVKRGGTLSGLINELEITGFIRASTPILHPRPTNLKKHFIADPYLHFFYKFLEPNLKKISAGYYLDNPTRGLEPRMLNILLGFAFERFCLDNAVKIAGLLGFSAVEYNFGPFFNRSAGVQADLCFDRADRVLTVCEVKYSTKEIGKEVIAEFEKKVQKLIGVTAKSIDPVLITVNGVSQSVIDTGYFRRVLKLEDWL